MNIGSKIVELRKKKKLTQQQLGELLCVTDKTISSWELNRTEPSIEDLKKISETLECGLNYLINENSQKNNIETEIKIKISEQEYNNIEKFLKENGRFINEQRQIDTYYEPTYRRFYKKNEKVTEWLRIGERGNKTILNYKNWYDYYCDEYEVEVDDINNLQKIFKQLNLEELIKVDKKRKTYTYKNKYEIDLDKVKELGYFIEIEIKKYNKELEEEYKELIELAKNLNLNLNNQTKKGYSHILLENKEIAD